MLPALEAATVREVTAWDAVEESVQLKLVGPGDDPDNVCLMDTPTSQAFEDALCATQQAALEPPQLPQETEVDPLHLIRAPKVSYLSCNVRTITSP